LFFHFIYPVHKAPRRVTDLYAHFVAPVLATYQAFGIHARLRPINDIHVNDRKIGGTGAAQIGDATIFVGSFMLDFDVETMARCLKVPSEKFRDKLRGTLHDYITTMRRELGAIPPREALVARFLRDVGEQLGVEPRSDHLRADETRAVDEWECQLQEPDWLYQPNRRRFADGVKITGGVHLGEAMHKARGGLVRVRLLSQNQRIADVDISGDFTCIPASGVEALAHALRGLDLASADMTPRIAQHMTTLGLDLPGVDAADIASAIRGACARED
jgi:lipoate-protein ligase A